MRIITSNEFVADGFRKAFSEFGVGDFKCKELAIIEINNIIDLPLIFLDYMKIIQAKNTIYTPPVILVTNDRTVLNLLALGPFIKDMSLPVKKLHRSIVRFTERINQYNSLSHLISLYDSKCMLTEREKKIALLILRKLSVNEIAQVLHLKKKTVYNNTAQMKDKLGVKSLPQLGQIIENHWNTRRVTPLIT